jgi:hypothetical protein
MSSCGSDKEGDAGARPGLRVERSQGQRGPEVIVYVARPADNAPQTVGGAKSVRLRCVDRRRRVVVTARHAWPFTDTDDGLVEAHVHQRIPPAEADRVESCELLGTRKPLRGRASNASY